MEQVIRYVVTHIDKDGQRVMAAPAQGRHTYATKEECDQQIAAMKKNNNAEVLKQYIGNPDELKSMQCPCRPGHFDPVLVFFDDDDGGATK